VPSGSLADAIAQQSVTLDRGFNKVIGIGYAEVTDGGIPGNYDVGAKTQRQQWMDPFNVSMWLAQEAVGPNDKFYRVNIPYASGDSFYVTVTPGSAPASNLVGQMILILKRDMTELPK